MQPPDEVMVRDFLPSMRHLVSWKLRTQGYSQNRIASILGVTQASVSSYLSTDPAGAYRSLSGLSLDREMADDYVNELAEEARSNPTHAVATVMRIWEEMLGKGWACMRHRNMYPSLADCDFCIKEYGKGKDPHAEAISEVADAVRILEASPVFVGVMPEVSVNVACVSGDASTPEDVVAVPGRVVRVKDRAHAMLPPEAGASMHMSRVLLAVREERPDIRACINLRYDDRMERVLKTIGLRTLPISGRSKSGADDPTAEALERALRHGPGRFDAVVDLGGNGIEPNLYLLSAGAPEAAELAVEIARKYSAR